MRVLLIFLVVITSVSLKAQTPLLPGGMNYSQRNDLTHYPSISDSSYRGKKWSLHKYAGISASYGYFNGGSGTVLSVPVGLQLNRRLTNNLYAFAGVEAAPAFTSFNQAFVNSNGYKYSGGNSRFNSNGFAMYSKFEMGLMYINDERTFSISGSIGVYKSSYPPYPVYPNTNVQKPLSQGGSRQ